MTQFKNTGVIEPLKALMDELCAADLTLNRSEVLRRRLFELLELEKEKGPDLASGRGTLARVVDSREGFHPIFSTYPPVLQRPCVG